MISEETWKILEDHFGKENVDRDDPDLQESVEELVNRSHHHGVNNLLLMLKAMNLKN